MSARATAWAFAQEHLTSGQRLLLLVLADSYDELGQVVAFDARMLAELIGCSDRHVRRMLADLVAAGLLDQPHPRAVRLHQADGADAAAPANLSQRLRGVH